MQQQALAVAAQQRWARIDVEWGEIDGSSGSAEIELLYAVKLYSHYLQFLQFYSPYVYVLKSCQELNISPFLHIVFPSPFFHPVVLISRDYHISQPNLANSSLPCVISHCICCSLSFLSCCSFPFFPSYSSRMLVLGALKYYLLFCLGCLTQ